MTNNRETRNKEGNSTTKDEKIKSITNRAYNDDVIYNIICNFFEWKELLYNNTPWL